MRNSYTLKSLVIIMIHGVKNSRGWTIRGVNIPVGEQSGGWTCSWGKLSRGWTLRRVNHPGVKRPGVNTIREWIVLDPSWGNGGSDLSRHTKPKKETKKIVQFQKQFVVFSFWIKPVFFSWYTGLVLKSNTQISPPPPKMAIHFCCPKRCAMFWNVWEKKSIFSIFFV